MHFQLQKLVQFCFCLCRTAMCLHQYCTAPTIFNGYCKCSVNQICIEQCTTSCRNIFHLSLTIGRSYVNTDILFVMFELVLSCFGARHCLIAMHCINTYIVTYIQCHMQLQVQQTHDCASCNMQLANSLSHMILNARLHCVNSANFSLYFLYHYYLHCIVLHVQHFQCLLARQGCCATASFAHETNQTYF